MFTVVRPPGAWQPPPPEEVVVKFAVVDQAEQLAFTCQLYKLDALRLPKFREVEVNVPAEVHELEVFNLYCTE